MAVVELTAENFKDTIDGNGIVVVDYWAPWCAPCRSFAPTFEDAAERNPDITFAKINTEDEGELATTFQIRSIPTLMIFRERVIIFQQAGVLPGKALDELIEQAKDIDMEKVHAEVKGEGASVD